MKITRLHLDLTNKCNLRCVYCYVNKRKEEEDFSLSPEQWLKIIDQAFKLGIKKFIISGGEPLLYPGFKKIFTSIESHKGEIVIMSNLTKECQPVVKKIVKSAALKEIVTSIDGLDSHHIARPPSVPEEVINNIRLAKGKNIKITVNTVVHKYNTSEIPNLVPIVKNIKINRWRLDIPIRPNNLEVMPDLEKVVELAKKLIKRRYKDKNFQKINLVLFRIYTSVLENISIQETEKTRNLLSSHPCKYFFGTATIKPDGNISICSPMEYSLGNVIESNLDINLKTGLDAAINSKFFDMKIKDVKGCKEGKLPIYKSLLPLKRKQLRNN